MDNLRFKDIGFLEQLTETAEIFAAAGLIQGDPQCVDLVVPLIKKAQNYMNIDTLSHIPLIQIY
ncbi:MAG: hypothetical protein N2746_03440 [Deltaproteobacteria bacterium]|nr:hypothetical protein [Deltaproteobacteria bacterium]